MRMTLDFANLVAPLVPLVIPFLGIVLAFATSVATLMILGKR